MRWDGRDAAGMVEGALVRMISVGLALTAAAQVMLTSGALRPLLNLAHRAEGFRVDDGPIEVVRMQPDHGSGVAVLGLRLEAPYGGAEAGVWVGRKYAGRLYAGDDDSRVLYVAVRQGDEITLKRVGGAPFSVTVFRSSGSPMYPAVGTRFAVWGETKTIGPVILR